MGETLLPVPMGFNRSLRIESRVDRLTGDPGAVLLREIVEQSSIVGWMTARLTDPRSQVDAAHDIASLIRTGVLLAAQGWRDHADAGALRHDPARRTGHQFGGRADAAERSGVGVTAYAVTLYCADGRAREPIGPARGGAGVCRVLHQSRAGWPGGCRPSPSMSTVRQSKSTATSRRPNGMATTMPGSTTH